MYRGMRPSPGVGGCAAFPRTEVAIEGLAARERREIPLREGDSIKICGKSILVERITPAASELWGSNPHEASLSVNIPGAMRMDEVVSSGRPYYIGSYRIGLLDAKDGTATFEVKGL